MRENWRCVVELLFAAIQAVIDEGEVEPTPAVKAVLATAEAYVTEVQSSDKEPWTILEDK